MKTMLPILVLATVVVADPIPCQFLGEPHVIEGDCRCILKQDTIEPEGMDEPVELRKIVQTCVDAHVLLEVSEAKYKGEWGKITASRCQLIVDAEQYSCEIYDYSKPDFAKNTMFKNIQYSAMKREVIKFFGRTDSKYIFKNSPLK